MAKSKKYRYEKDKKAVLFLKQNKFLIILFSIALAFFIWQHTTGLSWDFMAYVLNARYWFNNGSYFEWTRPPLAPLAIGIFSFLGWKAAEYAFIVLVCFLHLFSSVKLAQRLKINKILFYALSLSPFLLISGLSAGTELLSLALLQFFAAFLGTKKSPLFLALATLTRYHNLVFLPLLFFTKNKKKFSRDILILTAIIAPWLLFNFLATGNALTSIIDICALGMKFRSYIFQPFSFMHVLTVTSYLLPFCIAGIIIKIKEAKKFGYYWFMIIFIFIALVSYAKSPVKVPRYLFTMLIPVTYFSALAIKKIKPKKIIAGIIILLVGASFTFAIFLPNQENKEFENPAIYLNTLNETQEQIKNCAVCSNAYIHLNYLGTICERAPYKKVLPYKINQGYKILLFKRIAEPNYLKNETFLNSFPVISQNSHYILLGNSSQCAPIKKVDQTYLASIDELYKITYNESFSITFYELLFTDKTA